MNLNKVNFLVIFIFSIFTLASCSKDPVPIEFGTDDCDYCKMTISDSRFGAEIVTDKGRIYKFDDIHCVKGFLNDEIVPADQVHSVWFVDFVETETLINANQSFLLHNEELKSPMASNVAAFGSKENLAEYQSAQQSETEGEELKWEEYLNSN